jgi:hypothetical protein
METREGGDGFGSVHDSPTEPIGVRARHSHKSRIWNIARGKTRPVRPKRTASCSLGH